MCLFSFSGFLHFSELANLKRNNITFFDSHAKLYLEQSKTDIYREGKDVLISRTLNITCPVNIYIYIYIYICCKDTSFQPTIQIIFFVAWFIVRV